ncbi:MAG: bile acid:sodium symporter family protein [Pseudomonadota bacterium]|nr:bile acid:sodium symporter family protein [Pseudomonadota bacterium]
MGIVTNVILPLALAFIMFSLGLGLTVKDFTRVVRQPKDFFVGLVSQIILLPLVGYGLITIWSVSPEIALGVMIIAAAPGGVTSNLLTAYGKGDVALSISLTAIVSLLSVFTIPFIVVYFYQFLMKSTGLGDISVLNVAIKVFLIVTVPMLLGLAVRHYNGTFAIRFESIAQKISAILFVLVLLGAVLKERENIAHFYAEAGLITLSLNVIMIALAWLLAAIFSSGPPQRTAISIECGLQNGTVAIAVATLIGSPPAVIPAATYSLTMFGTALILVYFLRKQHRNR